MPSATRAARAARRRSASWRFSPHEQRDALDVRGVRKHVDRACGDAAIAGAVHEQARVARERRRIAAHVDDPFGPRPLAWRRLRDAVDERLDERERAYA